MNWTSQFFTAVSSALTTAILLYIVRQIVKLRKSATRLMKEHRYLMATMQLVLSHLGLKALMEEQSKE